MRKILLVLLVGAGAVFVLAVSTNGQPEEVGPGQLPYNFEGLKLVPIHGNQDSLFVIVVDDEGAYIMRKRLSYRWRFVAGVLESGFENAEFKFSRTGMLMIRKDWTSDLYVFNGNEFESRFCPGRPIVDSHGNIHIISQSAVYYYSTDTLSTFEIIDTLDIAEDFVSLVTSPNDSIVAALFQDEETDSLHKYVAFDGEPIQFDLPSEVVPGATGITRAFDIALDYSGSVFYVVNLTLSGCPIWAWGCHYAWSEDFGLEYLNYSSDDVLDMTNFELTFGAAPGEVVAMRSTGPPWGIGTSFYASTDAGETWYSCSYYVSGFFVFYGSTPRSYIDRLDFTYFTNEDAVYYLPIPRDSIFQNLVSVEGEEIALPVDVHLINYPNPFNSRTTISFDLPRETDISLKVFGVSGGIVATLYRGHADAGPNSLIWDGRNGSGQPVSSGVYFYRLGINGDRSVTKRMLLIK